MRSTLAVIIIIFSASLQVYSQVVDTLSTETPTVLSEEEDYSERFVPRRASLYSAVLPGLGQAYNRDYWKIPLIYGGFTAIVLTVDFYHDNYIRFRKDLFAEIDENKLTINNSGFNEQQLRRLIDRTRRERDFFIIISGVLYFLQIAEAHIDAHLKEFDLNPDLKVKIEPVMRYNEGINSGIALKFTF